MSNAKFGCIILMLLILELILIHISLDLQQVVRILPKLL